MQSFKKLKDKFELKNKDIVPFAKLKELLEHVVFNKVLNEIIIWFKRTRDSL